MRITLSDGLRVNPNILAVPRACLSSSAVQSFCDSVSSMSSTQFQGGEKIAGNHPTRWAQWLSPAAVWAPLPLHAAQLVSKLNSQAKVHIACLACFVNYLVRLWLLRDPTLGLGFL